MAKKKLPLKEVSIEELYLDSDQIKYEIPIYQRNYAWERDEITTFIQDVFDAYKKDSEKYYYVGTLVSFYRGDNTYEIIDGQQRLTTIRIILEVLELENPPKAQLTYKARKKSDETLRYMPDFKKIDPVIGCDFEIVNGFSYAKEAYNTIVSETDRQGFIKYFKEKVHLIHYKVPKDIDLNHYFEIMNSRGEQLEKYEIVKANLIEALDREGASEHGQEVFNQIWEACSEMNVYIQQNLKYDKVFGKSYNEFLPQSYDDIKDLELTAGVEKEGNRISLEQIIDTGTKNVEKEERDNKTDSFQPIIDFSNFILIVLKITLMKRPGFEPVDFNLDDKELLREFDVAKVEPRQFCFNLLKARYLLDNYIVHHSKEDDTIDNNPWKLQKWTKVVSKELKESKEKERLKGYPRNLSEDANIQDKLVQLLSMFEVSFTARQRKNYLFYCLLYLMNTETLDLGKYVNFVENLAARYFHHVYLGNRLNSINVPEPGAFDSIILKGNGFDNSPIVMKSKKEFYDVFGKGETASKGIPLFIFNYLDYLLWKKYAENLRGTRAKTESIERKQFFDTLGCRDFKLDVFDRFYFSRTRRSLEHYYPQAMADGSNGKLNQNQINCFGNYAMIGSQANSSGSNWSPETKLQHYGDSSEKINPISVASLKFIVMMQICRDNGWDWNAIEKHQEKMVDIMCGRDCEEKEWTEIIL